MSAIICSITKNKFSDTALGNSDVTKTVNLYFEENNKGNKGLSQFYNECIDRFSQYDYIIFVHDDVQIINQDLYYQVEMGLGKYDVIGVAGCLNPKIKEKNLWHWMCEEKSHYRGIAGHPYDPGIKDSFYVTSFGPTPARVVLLDGVFLAIKTKKIIDSKVRFDEQFKFHHYDIDFSLQCNENKIKLGVWPILINHQSPGLKEFHKDWEESNSKFITKWKK